MRLNRYKRTKQFVVPDIGWVFVAVDVAVDDSAVDKGEEEDEGSTVADDAEAADGVGELQGSCSDLRFSLGSLTEVAMISSAIERSIGMSRSSCNSDRRRDRRRQGGLIDRISWRSERRRQAVISIHKRSRRGMRGRYFKYRRFRELQCADLRVRYRRS